MRGIMKHWGLKDSILIIMSLITSLNRKQLTSIGRIGSKVMLVVANKGQLVAEAIIICVVKKTVSLLELASFISVTENREAVLFSKYMVFILI